MSQCASSHCVTPEAIVRPKQDHTILAKILAGYRELVCELGGKPDALLEDAGISPQDASDPAVLLPCRAIGELLEDSAAALGCSDFGMRLTERQSMHTLLAPLNRLFVTAPTLRDSFQSCIRHMSAFNSGMIMELADSPAEGLYLLDLKLIDGLSLFPQLFEQLLLQTHLSVLHLSAGFARTRRVWFSHLRISPPVAYSRRFNAVIEFGQEYDGVFLNEADLKARVAESGPDTFASEARLIEERFPSRGNDIGLMVRQVVFRVLTQAEECTRHNVARLLGLQERTLNRRLSKQGTSFEAIRDEVRRDMAYRYLARADLPLTEIAGRLGYSEMAVLSRCCRRWFGTSPRRLRQDLLAGKPKRPLLSAPPRSGLRQLAA